MKDKLARSVYWIVWSRGGVQIISFISTLVVARLLHPSDYGLVALLGIWTTSVAMLAEMGLGDAIIQFRNLEKSELNACFWLTVGLALLGYAALFLAAPGIAKWFETPQLTNLLKVGGLMPILVAARVVPESLLRKQLQLDKVSQTEIAAAMLGIPVTIIMAWQGAGAWALVIGVLVMQLTQGFLCFVFVRWIPSFQTKSARVGEILRYSLSMLGSKVSGAMLQQADVFALGKISGDVVLGFYSMSKRLAVLPVNKLSTVAVQLATPVMAEFQSDREKLGAAFLRGLRQLSCLSIPACVGLALVGDDLILVTLTSKWAPAISVLRVLCGYAVIRSLGALLLPILKARYRTQFLFLYSVIAFVLFLPAFFVGAQWGGALGVALAWVIAYPLVGFWLAREALREINITWQHVWRQLRSPITSVAIMTAAVSLVRFFLPDQMPSGHTPRLMASIIVGVTVYSIAIWSMGGAVVSEFKEVLYWALRGRREAATSNTPATS